MMRLWVLLGLLWSSVAAAHTLDLTTARVTLREGHIEVVAELDLLLLLGAAPTMVATASEAALAQRLASAQELLRSKTRLEVDGTPLELVLRDFPVAPEVRAMAATLSAADKEHGALVRLRLEATSVHRQARSVALSLPAVLGPSLVSFVQPSSRFTPPGAPVSFAVLTAPPQAGPTPWLPWKGLGVVLAAGALGVGLRGPWGRRGVIQQRSS